MSLYAVEEQPSNPRLIVENNVRMMMTWRDLSGCAVAQHFKKVEAGDVVDLDTSCNDPAQYRAKIEKPSTGKSTKPDDDDDDDDHEDYDDDDDTKLHKSCKDDLVM